MSHQRFGSVLAAVCGALLLAASLANVVWSVKFGHLYFPLQIQNLVSLGGVALGLRYEWSRRLDRTDRRLRAVEDQLAREDKEAGSDLAALGRVRALRSVGH